MRHIAIIYFVILICSGCKKDKTNIINVDCKTDRFYYNDSGKIALSDIPNEGTISFYDTLSFDTINAIIKPYPQIKWISVYVKSSAILISINSNNCSTTDSIFAKIKLDKRVSNCNKYLTTKDGNQIGLYDIFLCSLKNNSDTVKMNDLILKTRTRKVRFDYSGGYYFIRADKFSEGDALDLSNIFYESGIFIYAEPNFFIKIIPLK